MAHRSYPPETELASRIDFEKYSFPIRGNDEVERTVDQPEVTHHGVDPFFHIGWQGICS